MNKSAKAVIAVLVCGLGAGGAIAANHEVQCSNMENDYLNSVSSVRHSSGLDRLAAGAAKLAGIAPDRSQIALTSIYAQCGQSAGETASRKALAFNH